MYSFVKQPVDTLDYDLDMSDWFSDLIIDEISSITITITSPTEASPTLISGSASHPPYTLLGNNPVSAKLWLSQGTVNTTYIVTCVVFTKQDRVKEVEFKIKVRNL